MEAIVPHRKKIIALKGDTSRALSVMAAKRGTNLKRLIETMLDKTTDKYDEDESYRYLSESYPDGKITLGKREHKESID